MNTFEVYGPIQIIFPPWTKLGYYGMAFDNPFLLCTNISNRQRCGILSESFKQTDRFGYFILLPIYQREKLYKYYQIKMIDCISNLSKF